VGARGIGRHIGREGWRVGSSTGAIEHDCIAVDRSTHIPCKTTPILLIITLYFNMAPPSLLTIFPVQFLSLTKKT
jgi:hypothetical protein